MSHIHERKPCNFVRQHPHVEEWCSEVVIKDEEVLDQLFRLLVYHLIPPRVLPLSKVFPEFVFLEKRNLFEFIEKMIFSLPFAERHISAFILHVMHYPSAGNRQVLRLRFV